MVTNPFIFLFCPFFSSHINLITLCGKILTLYIFYIYQPLQLYVKVSILLTSGKHLHDHIISQGVVVWANTISLIPQFFFLQGYLYQGRHVSGHVFASQSYQFCPFLLFIWNCSDSVVLLSFILSLQQKLDINRTTLI